MWAAEAYGTDCVTPLAWLGATTERISVGSAIMQIPARTPANTAMTAATLDLLSGGRFLLGLGTSGPQVVEGWHGQPWGKPLDEDARVRRDRADDPARERAARAPRRALRHPLHRTGRTGLGKPLKIIVHPPRADIPIYLAAIGPKNVALAAEIADGWLPIFCSPERAPERSGPALEEGFALRGGRDDCDLAPLVPVLMATTSRRAATS